VQSGGTSSGFGAADYGSVASGSTLIEIGYMTGGGGASADSEFSESAIYNYELSPARILAHAQAAGLAP
jgi:hypothetical protein